jgi:RNA polymerase sigma-70 factor, ECF subfamily
MGFMGTSTWTGRDADQEAMRVGKGPDLEQIYREHHAFAWRVVRRLGVPAEAVDDAVQEIFVVLHRRRAELDFSRSIRALVYGVARRVARRGRERLASRATLTLAPAPDPRPDPEARALLREKATVVRDALDAMDEDKRMTFVLSEIEGLSIPEVAECLGVNLNTAYARQRAARQLVRAAIARHLAREEWDLGRAGRR